MNTLKRQLAGLPRGIALRISVLCWTVALITLAVFVVAVIPEQKKDLQAELESKALGVTSSLQGVTASAAVSEDYSTLVEQCSQLLSGDEGITYLIITRNDGNSVVVNRSGWKMDTLDAAWHPYERVQKWELSRTPQFDKRVFRFSRPFDYSGLRWGWMHVGLSISRYDQSVKQIYQRSFALAAFCMMLGLLFSFRLSKQLVRPIADLQAVVCKLARGDLNARARISRHDEVGSLAESFNSMADSLMQRNQILETIRLAAQELLSADDWQNVMEELVAKIGASSKSKSILILDVKHTEAAQLTVWIRHIWPPSDVLESAQRDREIELKQENHVHALIDGEVLSVRAEQFSTIWNDNAIPHTGDLLIVPVRVSGSLFSLLCFENTEGNLAWSDAELDSFRALADMLGASISRQRAQQALVEAKQTLEIRVVERTKELQEQVNAKERAHAELARAQRELIDFSRQSGMAEIATGVLHNVGNVLNSVNVAATLVACKIRDSRVDKLTASVELLRSHEANLAPFLTADPKGRRLLPYLGKLAEHFESERESLIFELQHLTDHIDHIKQIVATQQDYAKVSGLIELVSLSKLVQDAFRMIESGFERHHITVKSDIEELPTVPADKHKILQILLNLLRNAKQSVVDYDGPLREIRVSVRNVNHRRIRIEVQDSGLGLSSENLTRIFAHGFTTKKTGHGFGLHSGALAAREMGGALWAESDGMGHGATFILEFPVTTVTADSEESQKCLQEA